MAEVFAERVYARGEIESLSIAMPGPENEIAVRLDRSGLAGLPDEPVARVEVWYALDGTTWKFHCAFDLNGGEAKNPRTGEVVTHAEIWGNWLPGRDVAARRVRLRLRTHRVIRCSVTFTAAVGAEPPPRQPPASVAHALAGSNGTSGVTGVTQSITVAGDANRLLLAFTGVDDNESADPIPVITFNTTETTTEVATLLVDVPGSQDVHMRVHRRIAPSATTANLVWAGMSAPHRWFYGWCVAYNVDQTTPEGTEGTNTATSGDALSGSCTGVTDGLAYGFACILRSSSPTIADAGGQTARTEKEGIASRVAGSIATIAGSGTLNFAWSAAGGTTQGWGVIALPLNPASAAVTAVGPVAKKAWHYRHTRMVA